MRLISRENNRRGVPAKINGAQDQRVVASGISSGVLKWTGPGSQGAPADATVRQGALARRHTRCLPEADALAVVWSLKQAGACGWDPAWCSRAHVEGTGKICGLRVGGKGSPARDSTGWSEVVQGQVLGARKREFRLTLLGISCSFSMSSGWRPELAGKGEER